MPSRSLRTVAGVILAAAALLFSSQAGAFERLAYTNATLEWARAGEGPYVVFVHADWCTTCRAQDRALEQLADDPRFFNLRIVVVDYDTQTHIMRFFNTPERSTFVAFRGTTETLRMSGVTSVEGVEAFLLRAME